MFGLGFWEMAIIALVVILFVKPDELPSFFRKMGKLYGQATQSYHLLLMNLKNSEKNFKDAVDNTVNWEGGANTKNPKLEISGEKNVVAKSKKNKKNISNKQTKKSNLTPTNSRKKALSPKNPLVKKIL